MPRRRPRPNAPPTRAGLVVQAMADMRRHEGLTKQQFADFIGCSTQQLNNIIRMHQYEQGLRRSPSVSSAGLAVLERAMKRVYGLETERPCIYCGELHGQITVPLCSRACATAFGYSVLSLHRWCKVCDAWTSHDGQGCTTCPPEDTSCT